MSSRHPEQPRLTVAVVTYRRTSLLEPLLPRLVEEARTLGADVLVVDNDPDASARAVVEAAAEGRPEVHYAHEPRPGIAAARNAALAEVLARGRDAVVFIDDDETPVPGWLRALTDCWAEAGSQAVAGPVLSELPQGVDDWVLASGAFERRRRESGVVLASAATNNLLLDLAFLAEHGLRFDDAFGLTGGSDTLLTRQLVAAGGRIVWCDEALVTEQVPTSRADRAWVLRRKRRSGNVTGRVALELAGSPAARASTRVRLGVRASARVVRGVLVSRLARGDVARRATYECDIASGRGLLLAVLGRRVTEYVRTV